MRFNDTLRPIGCKSIRHTIGDQEIEERIKVSLCKETNRLSSFLSDF